MRVETIKQERKKENLETLPIIIEFQDVFPEENLGLHHPRDIDFSIDLETCTMLVYRSHYRMSILEFMELKNAVAGTIKQRLHQT